MALKFNVCDVKDSGFIQWSFMTRSTYMAFFPTTDRIIKSEALLSLCWSS